jgi:hypothetical protein
VRALRVLQDPQWVRNAANAPVSTSDAPYTVGGIPLCLDAGSSVVIDDITPVGTAGISVTGFAVRPKYSLEFTGAQRSLSAAGFHGGLTVTGACPFENGSNLGIQFSKPTDATARLDGLVVSWHSPGSWHSHRQSGTAIVPLHLVLCEGTDVTIPDCRPVP